MAIPNFTRGVSSVSVLLLAWAPARSLREPTTRPAAKPHGVAIADVNGDSRADLVVTDSLDNLQCPVLLGNGDGTLRPRAAFATAPAPPASPWRTSITTAGRISPWRVPTRTWSRCFAATATRQLRRASRCAHRLPRPRSIVAADLDARRRGRSRAVACAVSNASLDPARQRRPDRSDQTRRAGGQPALSRSSPAISTGMPPPISSSPTASAPIAVLINDSSGAFTHVARMHGTELDSPLRSARRLRLRRPARHRGRRLPRAGNASSFVSATATRHVRARIRSAPRRVGCAPSTAGGPRPRRQSQIWWSSAMEVPAARCS